MSLSANNNHTFRTVTLSGNDVFEVPAIDDCVFEALSSSETFINEFVASGLPSAPSIATPVFDVLSPEIASSIVSETSGTLIDGGEGE